MNKYKIIIFDLDDTLIDNFENVKYAFKTMVESKNELYTEKSFLRWYEIDKIFGKEYREIVGEEQRDPGFVDDKDTLNFSRIYHEVKKNDTPKELSFKQEYQEEQGVLFVKKVKRNQAKILNQRR